MDKKEAQELARKLGDRLVDTVVELITANTDETRTSSMRENCDRCHRELTKPGAVLLGPPNSLHQVGLKNICEECYFSIIDFMS